MSKLKAIIIEDDEEIRLLLRKIIEKYNCEVIGETDKGEHLIELVKEKEFDLLIIDINLKGDLDGFETAKKISEISAAPIIFISSVNFVDYESIIKKITIPNKIYYIDKLCFKDKIIKVLNQINTIKN